MKRLTRVENDGTLFINFDDGSAATVAWLIRNKCYTTLEQIATMLACYENLAEQDKMIKLPCDVGDTVYTNISVKGNYMRKNKRPYVCKVVTIVLNSEYNYCYINVRYKNGRMWSFSFADFGKIVFLTKEEAEAALKKMEVKL